MVSAPRNAALPPSLPSHFASAPSPTPHLLPRRPAPPSLRAAAQAAKDAVGPCSSNRCGPYSSWLEVFPGSAKQAPIVNGHCGEPELQPSTPPRTAMPPSTPSLEARIGGTVRANVTCEVNCTPSARSMSAAGATLGGGQMRQSTLLHQAVRRFQTDAEAAVRAFMQLEVNSCVSGEVAPRSEAVWEAADHVSKRPASCEPPATSTPQAGSNFAVHSPCSCADGFARGMQPSAAQSQPNSAVKGQEQPRRREVDVPAPVGIRGFVHQSSPDSTNTDALCSDAADHSAPEKQTCTPSKGVSKTLDGVSLYTDSKTSRCAGAAQAVASSALPASATTGDVSAVADASASPGTDRSKSLRVDETVDQVTRHLLCAREKIEAVELEFANIMGELAAIGRSGTKDAANGRPVPTSAVAAARSESAPEHFYISTPEMRPFGKQTMESPFCKVDVGAIPLATSGASTAEMHPVVLGAQQGNPWPWPAPVSKRCS